MCVCVCVWVCVYVWGSGGGGGVCVVEGGGLQSVEDGGRKSEVSASEFKSEDSEFDTLAVQVRFPLDSFGA